MQLDLIPYKPGIHGYLAEFFPGPHYDARHWSEKSVYMDGDAFEALHYIVDRFHLFGPVTLSGARLDRFIRELEEAAERIAATESPKDIWPYTSSFGYTQFNSIRDWQAGRESFSTMLRQLAQWMREVKERKQPVTILGI
ncbi:hypothetical protein [Pelagibius sp. 7325]|uniref:hypothetical protein n=1 Tax=Pelagibius sp. 7325 TaxID=3131994 RepID=UPI0030ECA752